MPVPDPRVIFFTLYHSKLLSMSSKSADKSANASNVSSRIWEGVLVVIQVLSIVDYATSPLQFDMHREYVTRLRSLLSKVAGRIHDCDAVYQFEVHTPRQPISPLYNRMCTLFLWVLTTVWKSFVVMMPIPIFNRTMFPSIIFHSKSCFPFLPIKVNVVRCYRLYLSFLRGCIWRAYWRFAWTSSSYNPIHGIHIQCQVLSSFCSSRGVVRWYS